MDAVGLQLYRQSGTDIRQVREGVDARATEIAAQGKTVFKLLDANGWGIGLTAGTVRHSLTNDASLDWCAYVPASLSYLDDAVFIHANLGWQRDGETRRDRLCSDGEQKAQSFLLIG